MHVYTYVGFAGASLAISLSLPLMRSALAFLPTKTICRTPSLCPLRVAQPRSLLLLLLCFSRVFRLFSSHRLSLSSLFAIRARVSMNPAAAVERSTTADAVSRQSGSSCSQPSDRRVSCVSLAICLLFFILSPSLPLEPPSPSPPHLQPLTQRDA